LLRVPLPVANGISKWVYRQSSREVRPYNIKFASRLPEGSPFEARGDRGGGCEDTGARYPRGILEEMSQEEFSAAFRRSPMKRAKLRGPKRNAAVVLCNIGDTGDAAALTERC
jgi:epoxyqueuosine reductase